MKSISDAQSTPDPEECLSAETQEPLECKCPLPHQLPEGLAHHPQGLPVILRIKGVTASPPGDSPCVFLWLHILPLLSPTQRFNSTQLLCISRLLPPVGIHGSLA